MKPYDASYFDRDRCKPFYHEGGEKSVLLIHGFSGSVAHMRPLGDALADRGYTVKGINLPGHATTEADMAKTDWRQWLQAAEGAAQKLRKRYPVLTVVGLSMGGVLALILAERMELDACVTLSAPMAAQNKLMRFAKVLSPLIPRIANTGMEERRLTLDPDFDYGYSGFPTRKAADLNRLIRMARAGLGRVTCPLLVVQSTGDKTIWPGSADCILNGVHSRSVQKLTLRDVPHVCTLSAELPAIVEATDQRMRALER